MTESNGESLGEHVVIAANLPYIAQRQYDALDPDVKNSSLSAPLSPAPTDWTITTHCLRNSHSVATHFPKNSTLS